jgi:hypothetical protein
MTTKKPEQLPEGVERRPGGSLRIIYYVTGPDGVRKKHPEPVPAGMSPREAAKLRAQRIADHARGERTVDTDKVTVGDALAAVLADYEKQGRRSLRTVKGHVAAIEAALGKHTLAVNVADKIDSAQLAWQRRGTSNATINRTATHSGTGSGCSPTSGGSPSCRTSSGSRKSPSPVATSRPATRPRSKRSSRRTPLPSSCWRCSWASVRDSSRARCAASSIATRA